MRCITGTKPKQWLSGRAEFWYNTNYHSATKMTPFQALYGKSPPVVIRGNVGQTSREEVSRITEERNKVMEELKEQLVKARNRMKQQAGQHRREVEYEVGELVTLRSSLKIEEFGQKGESEIKA